jgi:hypothetical protein
MRFALPQSYDNAVLRRKHTMAEQHFPLTNPPFASDQPHDRRRSFTDVANDTLARGETPFLHAHAERMGFEMHCKPWLMTFQRG